MKGFRAKKRTMVIKGVIKHLEHDIKEQEEGIKRDKQTIKRLKKLI